MSSDDEFTKLKEQFMQSCTTIGGLKYVVDKELANEVVNYILRQVNEFSRLGELNEQQHGHMLKAATRGLFILVFVNYYSEDLITKEPIYISGSNLLKLMYSRVFFGRDRFMALAEIDSKRPIMMSGAK
jgi:hypothetical protein